MREPPADVFISYRRGERELVASVARRLEARGVTCWYDAGVAAGVGPTTQPPREPAGILAVFFSSDMNADPDLPRHVAAADRGGRPVVLILTEETRPRGRLLRLLADRNWIKTYPDPMEHMESLVDLLSAIAGKPVPTETPQPGASEADATLEVSTLEVSTLEVSTLEVRQASLDGAISQLMHDSVEAGKTAPMEARAYVGRIRSAGGKTLAPGMGEAVLSAVTLGLYGVVSARRAIASFMSNIRKL